MTIDLKNVLKEVQENKALLLDVREKDEWEDEHFVDAQSLPLSLICAGKIPQDLPKDRPLYIHCMRGFRAEKAAGILEKYYANSSPLLFTFEEIEESGFKTD